MAGPGQIPGRYNLVIKGKYDTFDHQIPVEGFIQDLKNDDVPDKVSVIGLGEVFEDGELATELARAMDQRANDLEYQSPTVQFVVEGTFASSIMKAELEFSGGTVTDRVRCRLPRSFGMHSPERRWRCSSWGFS